MGDGERQAFLEEVTFGVGKEDSAGRGCVWAKALRQEYAGQGQD